MQPKRDAESRASDAPVAAAIKCGYKKAADNIGMLTFLLPLLAAAAFVLRAGVVSGFSTSVTTDLVQLSSPTDLLRTVGLNLVLFLVIGATIALAALAAESGSRKQYGPLILAGAPAALLIVFIGLLVLRAGGALGALAAADWLLICLGAIGIGIGFIAVPSLSNPGPSIYSRILFVTRLLMFAVVIGLALIVALGIFTMWLPPERIIIHGRTPATLYVLQESDRDLVVFNMKKHNVERIASSEVDYRQFCSKSSASHQNMPRCP
jgi:hypothetical protein